MYVNRTGNTFPTCIFYSYLYMNEIKNNIKYYSGHNNEIIMKLKINKLVIKNHDVS